MIFSLETASESLTLPATVTGSLVWLGIVEFRVIDGAEKSKIRPEYVVTAETFPALSLALNERLFPWLSRTSIVAFQLRAIFAAAVFEISSQSSSAGVAEVAYCNEAVPV